MSRYGMGFFDSPTREIALALYTGGFRPGLLANLLSKLPGPLSTLVEFNDVELTITREQPRVAAAARWQWGCALGWLLVKRLVRWSHQTRAVGSE
jgi:hypothetical protein